MKPSLLWILSIGILTAQDEDPFKEVESPGEKQTGSVYDFAEVHRYDDVLVKLDDAADPKLLNWGKTDVASHRGVSGKKQRFTFSIAFKVYEKALGHPDSNRGVILLSGDLRFPSLYCWLRPFSVHGERAVFNVSVPPEQLKETYIAFIPEEGKKRYLYNLADVVLHLGNKAVPAKE